jgi:hemolysin activation/secretion protein
VFTGAFTADIYRHPDVPAPLQLGGDTGLRGYPLSFQSGERRALLTLEERIYADWHPYRLIRVGGAVFMDAGRAWNGAEQVTANERVLTDWGFGLRVTDSRSSLGTVLHFDLAFPLNARDQVRSSQFVIKSQTSF